DGRGGGGRGMNAALPVRPLDAGTLRRRVAATLAAGLRGADHVRNAQLDARLIVAHGLDLPAERLPFHDDRTVSVAEEAAIAALVDRRLAGVPVARLVGRKGFWTLDLALSP